MLFVGLSFWLALCVLAFRRYAGRPTTATLLQYQGGVLYKRGRRIREVAGQVRVWTGVEKVIVVDKRPTSVSFENRAVALSDGATAVYGFSGSAEVRDLSKVLYCARNYSDLPAFVLLCCARVVLNGYPSGRLLASQDGIVQEIVNQAKPRLAAAGFELQAFRFTHLSIAAPAQQSGE